MFSFLYCRFDRAKEDQHHQTATLQLGIHKDTTGKYVLPYLHYYKLQFVFNNRLFKNYLLSTFPKNAALSKVSIQEYFVIKSIEWVITAQLNFQKTFDLGDGCI